MGVGVHPYPGPVAYTVPDTLIQLSSSVHSVRLDRNLSDMHMSDATCFILSGVGKRGFLTFLAPTSIRHRSADTDHRWSASK